MLTPIEVMRALDTQADKLMTLLQQSQERERVNGNTIRELLVTVRTQEADLREANARIRSYERDRA